MAKNSLYEAAQNLKVPVASGKKSGDPVLIGAPKAPAYCLTDRGSDGEATVKFGPTGGKFSVKAENGSGNSAVAFGDKLYLDAEEKVLSKIATGTEFGFALAAVASGQTAVIGVKIATY